MSFALSPVATALAASSAILAVTLIYEISAPIERYEVPRVTPSPLAASPAVTPFQPPALLEFSEIDERPIFNPSRTPFKIPEAKVVEAPRPPPSLTLVGVIVTRSGRIAITRAQGATASVNLIPGQLIDGWEVAAIETDHVTLRSNASTFEIKLQSPSAGQPSAQVRAQGQRPTVAAAAPIARP